MDFLELFRGPLQDQEGLQAISTDLFSYTYFPWATVDLSTFDTDKDLWFAPALLSDGRTTRETVLKSYALWVDVDTDVYPQTTFAPNLVVKSGHGWHLYWLLSEPLIVSEIEELNQMLIEDVRGADKACWNANRILRVPGYMNTKDPPQPVRLHRLDAGRYTKLDMYVLKGLDSKTRHKIRTGDRRGYRSRSERDWAVVTGLISNQATDALIHLIFDKQPVGDKVRDPATPEGYLDHTITKARESKAGSRSKGSALISGRDDGYYRFSQRGEKRLSTFTLHPRILLDATGFGETDAILCDVAAAGYTWSGVTFTRGAFTSVNRMDRECPVAAWQWLGRDEDVRELLPLLMQQLVEDGMPRVIATPTLGLYEMGGVWYFVGDKNTVSWDAVWDDYSGPIVALPAHKERPVMDLTTSASEQDLTFIRTTLPKLNEQGVIWPMIGWYSASALKPWLECRGYRLPILNVSGTKGSGKTTLIQRVFMPLFGQEDPRSYDSNTTRFVILALMGGTNAVPIAFSEFRYASVQEFLRYVLLAYDTGHDPRGRSDQTTIDYPLSAPFSVDGEDTIADPAAQERIVAVSLLQSTISEGSEAYLAFKEWQGRDPPAGRGFMNHFIRYALKAVNSPAASRLLDAARQASFLALPGPCPDRVRNNHIVVYFGILLWCGLLEIQPPAFELAISDALSNVFNPKSGRARLMADDFVETVVNAVANSLAHFRYRLLNEGKELSFQLSSAHDWWLIGLRRQNKVGLERASIRGQLKELEYVSGPSLMDGTLMYVVKLRHAQDTGLDVPSEIVRRKVG